MLTNTLMLAHRMLFNLSLSHTCLPRHVIHNFHKSEETALISPVAVSSSCVRYQLFDHVSGDVRGCPPGTNTPFLWGELCWGRNADANRNDATIYSVVLTIFVTLFHQAGSYYKIY